MQLNRDTMQEQLFSFKSAEKHLDEHRVHTLCILVCTFINRNADHDLVWSCSHHLSIFTVKTEWSSHVWQWDLKWDICHNLSCLFFHFSLQWRCCFILHPLRNKTFLRQIILWFFLHFFSLDHLPHRFCHLLRWNTQTDKRTSVVTMLVTQPLW